MTAERGSLMNEVGGPQFRLRPSIEPFVDRHGRLCLVRPAGDDLIVREPEAADIALVCALSEGWDTEAGLAERLGTDRSVVREKLDSLAAADIVLTRSTGARTALGGEDVERFSRQLPYLAELGDEVILQRRLRDSTVTVIGCGGLGTWTLSALACLGIGRFVLIDDDRVELSNLNRQIVYARDDLAKPKVTAAAAWVRDFDPAIRVNAVESRIASADDVAPHVDGAEVVVLAADWPPYEIARWVNAACVEARVPFIVAGQIPPLLKIGPTYTPGEGPCFACHEAALTRASESYEDYVTFRRHNPISAPTLGPASCVVGGLVALEVLHLLTGQVPATVGTAMLVDMRTLDVRFEQIDRDPECVACQHVV
jgi:molybdopterin-synthase adenylyltransferase